jgi:P27 family predicted phage terminase small subunit
VIRGRKPKPTIIKAAEGNPGKRRLNANELIEDVAAPRRPPWLSRPAKREWSRLVKILMRKRVLRQEDQVMLGILCEAYATMLDARKELRAMQGKGRSKMLAKSGNATVVNPLLYVIRDQIQTIHRIAEQFGLTPAARSRLHVEDEALPAAADQLEALLSGGVEADPTDPVVIQ